MLTELFPFLHPSMIDADLAAKLRRLATDLDALRDFPVSAAVLRDAPLIDQWAAMLTAAGPRLIGRVTGHPRLGDRPAMTSPLWAADPAGQWVRTTSRFYRLGEPADAEVQSVLQSVFGAYRGNDGNTREGRS